MIITNSSRRFACKSKTPEDSLRKSRAKGQARELRELTITKRAFLLLALFVLLVTPTAASAAKWSGVDESVVEKVAEEHGREAREPFINTDQGDLLLFVFLLAGTVGGFIGGYYWRQLTERAQIIEPPLTGADRSQTEERQKNI